MKELFLEKIDKSLVKLIKRERRQKLIKLKRKGEYYNRYY
jgi:hypothetical protein